MTAGRPIDSYLICATPRTGSTLLCGLLEATTVAGHPQSYFRQADEASWAAAWGVARPLDTRPGYADYLQAAITAGSTENGVFAARVMWGTLGEVLEKLATVYRHPASADLELLHHAFGRVGFLYLRRDDVVAQAVSWLRAEQTNLWFRTDQTAGVEPDSEPRFDQRAIQDLVNLIEAHNAAWQQWFSSVGISPHSVRYEDLDADPLGVTRQILEFLGLALPHGHQIAARHHRLADGLSAEWIRRFRAGT